MTCRAAISILETVGNPMLDVAEAVSEVAACFEAGWSLLAVSPCIEGGYRYGEVFGEVVGCHQLLWCVHSKMVRGDPLA